MLEKAEGCETVKTLEEYLGDFPPGAILYKTEIGYWMDYQGDDIIETAIHPAAVEAAAELLRKIKEVKP